VALETGVSLWGAIGEVLRRQLLPQRAMLALKSFRDLIEDGRAMLAGTYVERLQRTAAANGSGDTQALQPPAPMESPEEDETEFDPMSFDFGPPSEEWQIKEHVSADDSPASEQDNSAAAFRSPGEAAHTGELLKFLIDRTGYIKQLEEEDTPEAFSRIENLHELVNAAMDSKDRGETLDQFLDHAALVSDADAYDERAQITLMTLHAAKGLEFPLVFLCGLEEGLFPHSRTFLQPDDVEEERRLCYVGMTRAMDTLVLSRAVYRRRYGTDLPEASVPSRFLEEVPAELLEDIGSPRRRAGRDRDYVGTGTPARPSGRSPESFSSGTHYAYEDEDQSVSWANQQKKRQPSTPARTYNSIDNIAEFFASRGKKFSMPKVPVEEPKGKKGFRPGQKVRHPKYGEGTVYQREGDGEEAKLTVQFPRHGLKKLVEKYAQLEKA
jgi:DNA helicase II / ATP-dependent DNA helicase PcrA